MVAVIPPTMPIRSRSHWGVGGNLGLNHVSVCVLMCVPECVCECTVCECVPMSVRERWKNQWAGTGEIRKSNEGYEQYIHTHE